MLISVDNGDIMGINGTIVTVVVDNLVHFGPWLNKDKYLSLWYRKLAKLTPKFATLGHIV